MSRPLPKDSIKEWPEIFGEVDVVNLPLQYLDSIRINFNDKKSWDIKLTSHTRNKGWSNFEKNLSELVTKYKDDIHSIDFKVDTPRLKTDVIKHTLKFLNKLKL